MKPAAHSMRRLATDEAARRDVLRAVDAAPNGELADVDQAIAAYERRYGMSSQEARHAIERGAMRPTRDVERWMMALRVRDDLLQLKARAR